MNFPIDYVWADLFTSQKTLEHQLLDFAQPGRHLGVPKAAMTAEITKPIRMGETGSFCVELPSRGSTQPLGSGFARISMKRGQELVRLLLWFQLAIIRDSGCYKSEIKSALFRLSAPSAVEFKEEY
ncbi:hypothetical protein [Pseudomonas putida]